jgi:hypothetical protein
MMYAVAGCPDCQRLTSGRCWRHSNFTVSAQISDPLPDTVLRQWFGPVCWHPDRHASVEMSGTMTWTIVRCRKCGASVSASYGSPIPELPPMPVDADGKALGLAERQRGSQPHEETP